MCHCEKFQQETLTASLNIKHTLSQHKFFISAKFWQHDPDPRAHFISAPLEPRGTLHFKVTKLRYKIKKKRKTNKQSHLQSQKQLNATYRSASIQ